MSFLNIFVGDPNEKKIKKIEPLVEEINKLESKFEVFSNDELKNKTNDFKKILMGLEGDELKDKLNEILPEVFAMAREAAKRTIGQRHFDVQLIGGIVLHQSGIAEMKTGEGKTLSATTAIYLNALAGRGVHVVTVNDYLSRRDANWMGPIYHLLGLSCACLNHEKSYIFIPEGAPDKNEVTIEMSNLKEVPRQEAYLADITYGTNNEFGFDYLRDNMAPSLEYMAQREPFFAIIDEIDSILIDEARTPLIISAPDEESTKLYEQFDRVVPQLKENVDYNVDEKMRSVSLTEEGIARVEKIMGLDNIYNEGGIKYVHHLEEALKAHILFKRDKNYIVKNNEVIIVDEFTGRLMPGRRYSGGLHQALEAKERVSIQRESRTLASITFQNLFRMYPKLSGMTGTAATSAEEFHKVYNLEVAAIPTNKPMIRQDLPDKIFKSERGKFLALVNEIKERYAKGQPVLVGTVSIAKNELLSVYLKKAGIPHQILNAKNHEAEARIIAQAGQRGAVTVATNMAGRGVDIILGGRVESASAEEAKKLHDEVAGLGGLHIIGTERHEARRIDDQLRGRSGRQGDPGSSQFFVSLEDDLMRIFGGDRVKSIMEMLKIPEDQPIENRLISKTIESAQSRIEGYNFDLRKHILEYDDVMNKQREVIYKKRREILGNQDLKKYILETIDEQIKKIISFHAQTPRSEDWSYEEISETIKTIFKAPEDLHQKIREFPKLEKMEEYLIELAHRAYIEKEKELTEPNMRQVEKFLTLRAIDSLWMDHLETMDYLRDSVRLRAYGQKDPLVEYKNESIGYFQKLLSSIESTIVNMIYKVSIGPVEPKAHHIAARPTGNNQFGAVGRNDPCPCGKINPKTNKPMKYKKCCYPKYG